MVSTMIDVNYKYSGVDAFPILRKYDMQEMEWSDFLNRKA